MANTVRGAKKKLSRTFTICKKKNAISADPINYIKMSLKCNKVFRFSFSTSIYCIFNFLIDLNIEFWNFEVKDLNVVCDGKIFTDFKYYDT